MNTHTDALNLLLVDAEDEPITKTQTVENPLWAHLKARDKWDCPAGVTDRHCFLMVQSMETWIIADRDNLRAFYGAGFNENALPNHANLESVGKVQIMDALKRATKPTKTKGEYHKTQHGFDLIKGLNSVTVRGKSPSCDRLFTEVAAAIEGA